MQPSRLRFVTITGACDTTDIKWMCDLSELYPLLEWGILVGCEGSRFPGEVWMHKLLNNRRRPKNLSLHICGEILDSIVIEGDYQYAQFRGPWWRMFRRCQLNTHGEQFSQLTRDQIVENISRALGPAYKNNPDLETIFQLDGSNNDLPNLIKDKHIHRQFRLAGLHDISHGEDCLPDEWQMAIPNLPCGWAGGLGPTNLRAELARIERCAYVKNAEGAFMPVGFWVDMETHVRTADGSALDVKKVESCVDIATQYALELQVKG